MQLLPKNNSSIRYGYIVCTIGAIFYCYEFILRIIPGALQAELSFAFGNISASRFGQLSAFYYFAYSPMQLPVGILMDRFGPRRLLTFACFCCTCGSFLFSYTSNIYIAAGGRFLVGLGSSFAFVGVLSLATMWLPKKYFSLLAGLVTTIGMLGLIYGEIKITQMSMHQDLSYILLSMVWIGGILTLLIFLLVRDKNLQKDPKKLNLKLFFKDVLKVILTFDIWIIGIVAAFLYTSLSVFGELWGKGYLEQVHGLSKVSASKTISFLFLGWAIGAPIAGYFSDKFKIRTNFLLFGALLALICISIILYCPNLSYLTLNILMLFYGIFSSSEIIVFIMAKEISNAKLTGTVFAVINMIVTLGGVIFQPLVGKLLDNFGHAEFKDGQYLYPTNDYKLALSILPLSLILVLIMSIFLKDKNLTAKYS